MDLLANTPRDGEKKEQEEMKSPEVQKLEQEDELNLQTLVKEGLALDKIGSFGDQEESGPFEQKAIIQQKYEEFKKKDEEIQNRLSDLQTPEKK